MRLFKVWPQVVRHCTKLKSNFESKTVRTVFSEILNLADNAFELLMVVIQASTAFDILLYFRFKLVQSPLSVSYGNH